MSYTRRSRSALGLRKKALYITHDAIYNDQVMRQLGLLTCYCYNRITEGLLQVIRCRVSFSYPHYKHYCNLLNPLACKGNYMMSVHWSLMGGLLHLVQPLQR